MTSYTSSDDILFALKLAIGDKEMTSTGLFHDLANGFAEQTILEAEKFAKAYLLPLNKIGDQIGARFADGAVTTAPGWKEAYEKWKEGGWNGLSAKADYGGLALPIALNAACTEIWNSANIAFALCPLLSHGAIEALSAHASEELKNIYLPSIISGAWPATMNLTEPQAGTDLALLRTRAERCENGSYRIYGQKIYITYGEHDLSENIIHLVLARLPNAPDGTRGISLFLAPKFLPDETGAFTRRNDLRCVGLEHKLGIHGSPTCTMSFGDTQGATAFLIGEENNGLACMFTMMNNARLNVGIQGVALAERATQLALTYAQERKQGRALGALVTSSISEHPDVARMLLTMASLTSAARSICFETAVSLDRASREKDPAKAKAAFERGSLLTPLAKAFSSDIANETTSLGIQVFGGMGYIEETGAAQLMRDARICAIYEGTNGVQAADLTMRKIMLSEGKTLQNELNDMDKIAHDSGCKDLISAVEALNNASIFIQQALKHHPNDALAGATPYLRLFALVRGGTLLSKAANIAKKSNDPHSMRRETLAKFFTQHFAISAPALANSIVYGAGSTLAGVKIFN
jgi:alkylation response protein AidB-like acyl-CoA dehydrogenase